MQKKTILLMLMLLILLFTIPSCTTTPSKAYNDAVEAFADGEYADAAEAFEKLGEYSNAPTYAAYSRGLVLYDQGQYIAAEPYFAKVRDFMYGETRYQYCHGYVLEAEGKHAEAAAVFLSLGEYEDSSILYRYNNARYAESCGDYETALYDYQMAGDYSDAAIHLDLLRTQVYDQAVVLMAQTHYEEALHLFTMLGNYYDCPEQARICKQHFRDNRYTEAEALYNNGDLQGAYEIFISLTGFSDATSRAEEIGQMLGIDLPNVE